MKMTFYLMVVAVMIITACQSKTKTASDDADAIRSLEDQWEAALKAKDIDKIVGFFATDAVGMYANKPIFIGIEAIRKAQASFFSDTTIVWETYSSTIDTIEVSASGDLAYVRGADRISRNMPNEPVEDLMKWLDIWKKINGEWKCIVTIGNSDKPMEGQ